MKVTMSRLLYGNELRASSRDLFFDEDTKPCDTTHDDVEEKHDLTLGFTKQRRVSSCT